MAELLRQGDDLVLKLSTMEKAEAIHGDIRVPVAAVRTVTIVEDIIHAVHGLKLPGSRVPGVFAMGTFVSHEGRTFAIIHHQTHRGLKVTLQGTDYAAILIGILDPEAVLKRLGLPAEEGG